MERLQRQRDKVVAALTGEIGHVEMTRLGGELAAVQTELDQAEEAWLALAVEGEPAD
jgi:hypothetical protein